MPAGQLRNLLPFIRLHPHYVLVLQVLSVAFNLFYDIIHVFVGPFRVTSVNHSEEIFQVLVIQWLVSDHQ